MCYFKTPLPGGVLGRERNRVDRRISEIGTHQGISIIDGDVAHGFCILAIAQRIDFGLIGLNQSFVAADEAPHKISAQASDDTFGWDN